MAEGADDDDDAPLELFEPLELLEPDEGVEDGASCDEDPNPVEAPPGLLVAPAFVVAPPYSWATKPTSPAVLSTQLKAVSLVMDWTRRTPISREVGGV